MLRVTFLMCKSDSSEHLRCLLAFLLYILILIVPPLLHLGVTQIVIFDLIHLYWSDVFLSYILPMSCIYVHSKAINSQNQGL